MRQLRTELERAPAEDRDALRGNAIEALSATEGEAIHEVHTPPRRLSLGAIALLCGLGGIVLVPIVPPVGAMLLLMALLATLLAIVIGLGRLAAPLLLSSRRDPRAKAR